MPSTHDAVRTLAFRMVHALPGARDEADHDRAAVEALAPADRELAYQIAARRLAFQLVYELEVSGVKDDQAATFVRDALAGVEDLGPMAMERVAALALGAFAARQQADALFESLAPEWPSHRQAAVDRAILRLGWFEIAQKQTPGKIAVNEAVELAKAFSTDKSPAFVNALLDKVLNAAST